MLNSAKLPEGTHGLCMFIHVYHPIIKHQSWTGQNIEDPPPDSFKAARMPRNFSLKYFPTLVNYITMEHQWMAILNGYVRLLEAIFYLVSLSAGHDMTLFSLLSRIIRNSLIPRLVKKTSCGHSAYSASRWRAHDLGLTKLGVKAIYLFFLVGGWTLPLWKIWKSIGMMTFPIYGKVKNVPNHQAVFENRANPNSINGKKW